MTSIAMFGTFGAPDLIILSLTFTALLIGFQLPKVAASIFERVKKLSRIWNPPNGDQYVSSDNQTFNTVELKRKILIKQLFIIVGAILAVIALLNLLQ